MKIAALLMWVLTAIAGCFLLAARLADGGLRRQPVKVTRFPTMLVLGHPLLALVALAAWVEFLLTSRAVYAWSAFTGLVLVTVLGFMLLTGWLIGRGGKHARDTRHTVSYAAMLVHGVVATLTFVLVLLAALMIGRH